MRFQRFHALSDIQVGDAPRGMILEDTLPAYTNSETAVAPAI